MFIYGVFIMEVTEFCKMIHNLRDTCFSRNEMARRYPWHVNTIKAYELDRLCDVDYLFALATESGFDFHKLVEMRLKAGLLNNQGLDFSAVHKSDMLVNEANQLYKVDSPTDLIELTVNDDSMFPTIAIGARITINSLNKQLQEGDVFAVLINENAVPRRIQYGLNKSLMLVCDNHRFAPINLSAEAAKDLNVIGKVVATLNPL
jgi:hypothetical protein